MKNRYKVGLFAVSMIVTLLLGVTIGEALVSGTTFTISGGLYPGAPDYTIWKEDSIYYAKNANGELKYSGTNASQIIQNVINSLPKVDVSLPQSGFPQISAPSGSIYFKSGVYDIDKKIQIPLGSRITIQGDGYTAQQMAGKLGGTQIKGSDATGIFHALDTGTLKNGTVVSMFTGSRLIIRDIEFYQSVQQTNNGTVAVMLNGMSIGMLENVQITSYREWGQSRWGYGLAINTYGLGDYIQFINLGVFGFVWGVLLQADHLMIRGLGVGYSETAIRMSAMNNLQLYDVHIFGSNKTIQVEGGYPSLGNSVQTIYGLDLESVGGFSPNVWVGNQGMKVVIYRVMAVSTRSDVWTFQNASLWEFHDVIVNNTGASAGFPTPVFPSATAPAVVNNTKVINPNPNQVWVAITGGTVSSISINGLSTGLTSGRFLLRAKDYIKLVYSVAPSWTWGNFDVDERSG